MAPGEFEYNLQQAMQASGLFNFNPQALRTAQPQDFAYGPSIHSDGADNYYNDIGNAVIYGGNIRDPLFGFSSGTSQIGYQGADYSSFMLSTINEGSREYPPGGSFLNSISVGSYVPPPAGTASKAASETTANNANEKTNTQYTYVISYDGPDRKPTLVYKDSSGNTVKNKDVKNNKIYNEGQTALKTATEQWNKSRSS